MFPSLALTLSKGEKAISRVMMSFFVWVRGAKKSQSIRQSSVPCIDYSRDRKTDEASCNKRFFRLTVQKKDQTTSGRAHNAHESLIVWLGGKVEERDFSIFSYIFSDDKT